jgi:hypothetical protein
MLVAGQSLFQNYASVTLLQQGQVLLHSLVPMCINPVPVSGFEHTIKSMANQTLWLSLNYDGDGSWMLNGMLVQSLVMIHDGSYMKELSPEICSAATMIYCTIAKARCKCTWAEQSSAASPYYGEILGGLMTQLILNAAASTYHGNIPPVNVDCDNNGVVSHGNTPLQALPTNQTQADVLCVFKHLVFIQPFRVIFKYVQSHANDTKKWKECTLKEQINTKVDSLAKKALKAALFSKEFIEGAFPNKQIWITMGKKKAMGLLCSELKEYWGHAAAKQFFHKKQIVFSMHFDSVWWSGYDHAISEYPKTFCTFITKQVSGWCGSNSKLSLWEDNIINKCPQCGLEHKNSKHLTRCGDPGRLLQLHKSIKSIMDVLDDANVTSELTKMIKTYLLNQDRQTMGECIHPKSIFSPIAIDIDNIGWDCFVEG